MDSDHAGDKVSCRSICGFLIHMNTTLVQWFSKKQSTVEKSVFGPEFVAMKQDIDALRGLRYNLRMMGIPIYVLSYTYRDNLLVVHNTSKPESVLKKSKSVYYYKFCGLVAMGESLVGHIPSKENVSNLMTEVLYGQKRKYLVSSILYDIHDNY